MKLLLASDSQFLIKEGYKALGFSPEQTKIGYVITATKVARDIKFLEYIENYKKHMSEAGYKFEEIDIAEKSPEEIRSLLENVKVVHMEGGNTFYLLKIIRETGFDKIISDLLKKGVVYVGTSAGAYVMCPTVEVADWDKTGKSRFGITEFSALSYVPFLIKAHYVEAKENEVREKMKNLKYPLRILRDGQGLLIENGKVTFLGEGSEVNLT